MLNALNRQVGGNHYEQMKIQPLDYIMANKLGFCEGNVVKYVSRYKSKNGVEDLLKAKHYLEVLIDEQKPRITTNELRDVVLFMLAFGLLESEKNDPEPFIDETITQDINSVREDMREVINTNYSHEFKRIDRLVTALENRMAIKESNFTFTQTQLAINLLVLNLPSNERSYRKKGKRFIQVLAPALKEFYARNEKKIWGIINRANDREYEHTAVDCETLAYLYIDEIRTMEVK